MKSCLHILLLTALAFSVSSLTFAESGKKVKAKQQGSAKGQIFSVHDSNRDGFLNADEYKHFLAALETRRKHPAASHRKYPPPIRFTDADSNQDGLISEDELIEALNKRLNKHRRENRFK